MLLVALTGGIGSGKSTVARMLADRGAVVIHADALARRAVRSGSAGMVKVLDRFGPGVRASDGSIDRQALAEVVFADDAARRDLEAIVHPEVARLLIEELERHRGSDAIVVYEIPLLVETGAAPGFDVVVAVSADEAARSARLAADRGMAEEDARTRMRAQATDEEREAIADVVIRNDAGLEDLERGVDDVWRDLRARAS